MLTMINKFKLYYWPVVTTIWLLFTYVIAYIIAIFNEDVDPVFPYISDTGTFPPESCVFGQMLNVGAILMFITTFIRYKLVEFYKYEAFCKNFSKWNEWSFFFGILACIGISIVANFQETSVFTIHMTGTFLAFVPGSVYFIIQTLLTWRSDVTQALKFTRLFLVMMLPTLYLTSIVCGYYSIQPNVSINYWKKGAKEYVFHLASALSEWVMAISMCLYVLTFSSEFKKMTFNGFNFTGNGNN